MLVMMFFKLLFLFNKGISQQMITFLNAFCCMDAILMRVDYFFDMIPL